MDMTFRHNGSNALFLILTVFNVKYYFVRFAMRWKKSAKQQTANAPGTRQN